MRERMGHPPAVGERIYRYSLHASFASTRRVARPSIRRYKHKSGCPVLAFFARAGTMQPTPGDFSSILCDAILE